MNQLNEITGLVKQAATAAGFELAGIAPVSDFPDLNHFPKWIAAGHAGEMKYMESRDEAGNLKRASLKSTFPWARSVIVCALNYNTAHPYSTEVHDPKRGWIARYAWSQEDYHDAILRRLRLVEAKVREASAENIVTRCYVDTGPVVERVYAKYAGVGWIGKNTCILNQKLGSWLFLGVILTSLELQPDFPAPDRCGTCTRCIDACPTDALIAPYQLDANKCISYLTIEKRGVIPEEMRSGIGPASLRLRHLPGCLSLESKGSRNLRCRISTPRGPGQSSIAMAGGDECRRVPGEVPRLAHTPHQAQRFAKERHHCNGQ